MVKREPEHQDQQPDAAQPEVKDSDPIPESEWAPPAPERSYADAITDEHREHLAEFGMAPLEK